MLGCPAGCGNPPRTPETKRFGSRGLPKRNVSVSPCGNGAGTVRKRHGGAAPGCLACRTVIYQPQARAAGAGIEGAAGPPGATVGVMARTVCSWTIPRRPGRWGMLSSQGCDLQSRPYPRPAGAGMLGRAGCGRHGTMKPPACRWTMRPVACSGPPAGGSALRARQRLLPAHRRRHTAPVRLPRL